MIKKLFIGLYMFLIYALCLVLAIVSAGFTTVFYTAGADELNQVLIGALAIILETIKIILAFVYPFMAHRQGSETVRKVLNVCLVLSIIASLNFFMSLGTSPAAGFVNGIYDLIGMQFGKDLLIFVLNMTLSVIIEIFVIYVPRFAHIFGNKKFTSRKKSAIEKLFLIPRVLIERKIDSWVEAVQIENTVEVHEVETKAVEVHEVEAEEKEVEAPRYEIEEIDLDTSTETEPIEAPAVNSQDEIIHDISTYTQPAKYKDLVKNASDLLTALVSIKDADDIIQFSARELEEAFNISSWSLRLWKKELTSAGKITQVGNKIKVVA